MIISLQDGDIINIDVAVYLNVKFLSSYNVLPSFILE